MILAKWQKIYEGILLARAQTIVMLCLFAKLQLCGPHLGPTIGGYCCENVAMNDLRLRGSYFSTVSVGNLTEILTSNSASDTIIGGYTISVDGVEDGCWTNYAINVTYQITLDTLTQPLNLASGGSTIIINTVLRQIELEKSDTGLVV